MPRKPRAEVAGGIHHVYARGNREQLIYHDDIDRRRYLTLLEQVVARQRWLCFAYCLMNNHMHLLIETQEPNLGDGMRWLHGLYAQSFNRRHRATGHLFQGRFGAVRQTSDAQVLVTARYIARNPVESGLCAQPGDWPWSSHAAAAAPAAAPAERWLATDRLLSFFGASGGDSRRRYDRFVTLR